MEQRDSRGKKNNQIFVNVSKISLVISVFLLQMCGSKLFKSGVPVEKNTEKQSSYHLPIDSENLDYMFLSKSL